MMPNNKPTIDQFTQYQKLFDVLNEKLFHDDVPHVILNFSRKSKTYGFFSADRWHDATKDNTHEISLNPDMFNRDFKLVLSTLVHEMCHLWQHACGVPARGRYHNREWGMKMKEVGLYPSSTGQEGGKEVGDKVSHYIIDSGAYDTLYKELQNAKFPYLSTVDDMVPGKPKKPRKNSKVKYMCPNCNINIWGKSRLDITCTLCKVSFVESEVKK